MQVETGFCFKVKLQNKCIHITPAALLLFPQKPLWIFLFKLIVHQHTAHQHPSKYVCSHTLWVYAKAALWTNFCCQRCNHRVQMNAATHNPQASLKVSHDGEMVSQLPNEQLKGHSVSQLLLRS